LNYYKSIGDRE